MKKPIAQFKKKISSNKKNYVGLIVCCAVVAVFVGTLISQQITLANIRSEKKDCINKITAREEEFARLKEKAEYNSTDEYYEEKARDEGYVREDETVFIVGN